MYHDQGHIPVKLRAGRHSAALSIGAQRADAAPLLGAVRLVTTGTVLAPQAG
jgi:4-hydroxythreonine-4-phosphate dehydrogenase